MPWFWQKSDAELQAALLEDARIDDRHSRLWDRAHSPVDENGMWTDEATRNNAQLMREADADRIDGYVSAGFDRDKITREFKEQFWWWGEKYD